MKLFLSFTAGALTLAAVAVGTSLDPEPVRAADSAATDHVWWTSSRMEPDTLASAWLIRRFIDPSAEFHFVERGEVLEGGTPFDLPLVPLSRTVDRSTFTVLRDAYDIEAPGLDQLANLIDEIEIGRWDSTPGPEAEALEAKLRACLGATDPLAAIDDTSRLLDSLLPFPADPDRAP